MSHSLSLIWLISLVLGIQSDSSRLLLMSPTPSPTGTTPSPTEPTPSPTDGTPSPTDGTPSPTDGTPSPTDGTPSPTDGTPAPTDGTPAPTDGTPAPTDGTPAPTEMTPSPTDGTPSPTLPTCKPGIECRVLPFAEEATCIAGGNTCCYDKGCGGPMCTECTDFDISAEFDAVISIFEDDNVMALTVNGDFAAHDATIFADLIQTFDCTGVGGLQDGVISIHGIENVGVATTCTGRDCCNSVFFWVRYATNFVANGEDSAYNIRFLARDPLNGFSIVCNAESACESAEFIIDVRNCFGSDTLVIGGVTCQGQAACRDASFTFKNTAHSCTVEVASFKCDGDEACRGVSVVTNGNVVFTGADCICGAGSDVCTGASSQPEGFFNTKWTVDYSGKSTQFRIYNPCNNRFIRFEMEDLTEYDARTDRKTKNKETAFASISMPNHTDEPGSAAIKNVFTADSLTKSNAKFQLTTIFAEKDVEIDCPVADPTDPDCTISLRQSQLEFAVKIENFIQDTGVGNYAVLCIGVMTNSPGQFTSIEENSDDSIFTNGEYKIDNPSGDEAKCDGESLNVDVELSGNDNNQLRLCYRFGACDGTIEYDPIISENVENVETAENRAEFAHFSVYLVFVCSFFCLLFV